MVKKASERFREQGLRGIGIAKLMRDLGLTHGGFYGHFRNKNDLIATAMRSMFAENLKQLEQAVSASRPGEEVAAIVSSYLTSENRDHPERCCLLPTLAAEISRQPRAVQRVYTEGFTEQVRQLAQFMSGATAAERERQAHALMAGMAGTMMFARAVNDPELSEQILSQGREFYVATFATKNILDQG